MEFEPENALPRESEALLVVVDSHTKDQSSRTFESLRDAAMRMARTRLIYSTLKDDLLSVIKCGSSQTDNKLAIAEPTGYEGIEVLQPPASKSLAAVRILSELTLGTTVSNLLDVLDVCGDTLSEPAADRAKRKRVVIFTDGKDLCNSVTPDYVDDFAATCELYKEHGFQVDIICSCDESVAEKVQELDEELGDLEPFCFADALERVEGFELKFPLVLCRATGGILIALAEASTLVDRPTPKVKRAMAKYRGTLNIADIIKIPIKRFSHVHEAKPPTAKKISWDATVKRKQPVYVLVETQRVASAKDEAPLEAEEIVNAYPYGPELVPEQNEIDTYAWSIHLPKGLDTLGFVAQVSVPQRLFMGRVDVILAMPGVSGADELMKSLVLAMQAEKVGIIARLVTANKGGSPHLVFLWPRVELNRKTRTMRNFFLHVVEIPMREDIRNLPFASLDEATDELANNACSAMEMYISSTMLERNNVGREDPDDDDDEDAEILWPPQICNPNMDWFNICVVHRALCGISGSDFPPLSEWHRNLIDPLSFVRRAKKDEFSSSIADLKAALPIIRAKRNEKKGKRMHEALNGDLASIVDYLPPEMGADEERDDGNRNIDDTDLMDHNAALHMSQGDMSSIVSDTDAVDVGDETPVADFEALVKHNMFNFAAVSLLVVIRRLIRDLADDDKALECLKSLRLISVERKELRFFNDFIVSLVARCQREDVVGNRTSAFFRHVDRRGELDRCLQIIPLATNIGEDKGKAGDRAYNEFLKDISRQVMIIAKKTGPELSVSALSEK